MEMIRRRAFARAGLIGNPSDGYHGRTLSVTVPHFFAEVVLYEWEELEIILSQDDRSRFGSISELSRDVELHGYYGGVRLVKATIRRFYEYCQQQGIVLHGRTFSIRYESNIPRAVGLAGSSAIIVATLRALMDFYGVAIPLELQPSLALSVETHELGIAAGLQDRVVQTYEGLVFMDFSTEQLREQSGLEYGLYEQIDPKLLPPIYVAFSDKAGEPTEATHGPLRARYDSGDVTVRNAMTRFAELADESKQALLDGDHIRFSLLVDENFDLRNSVCDLSPVHLQMIETARAAGASAKFAGSGGAIVGTYPDEESLGRLRKQLTDIECEVVCLAPTPD